MSSQGEAKGCAFLKFMEKTSAVGAEVASALV
jgi:hypothetical protein